MEPKESRKRPKYTLKIFSDMKEESIKQIYLGSRKAQIIMCVLVMFLITNICYCIYSSIVMSGLREINRSQTVQIKQLMAEKETLETENAELDDKVAVLSETINQKVKLEEEQKAEFERMSIPNGFPMTGAVSIADSEMQDSEKDDEQEADESEEEKERSVTEEIMVFEGTEGNMIVAAGNGVVMSVETDSEYGNRVVIDHGNGYQSIYKNKGDAIVKNGDEIDRGATLFLIDENNTELGYQIMKDGIYIHPEDMVEING